MPTFKFEHGMWQESTLNTNTVESSRSRNELEAELADAELLHNLSIELIQENGIDSLYKKIVEGAVKLMRSDFGTIQMLYPDGHGPSKLRLLAASGFTSEEEKYWEWVYQHSFTSCGEVLRSGKRVIIPDYATEGFMQGSETLKVFLESNIHAAQSTPLVSRSGKLLGMISTHWKHKHIPEQRHLRLLDILARQAADLIERESFMNELEVKVEERTKELKSLNESLQQFAHVASHDLKEPVRKIRTFGLRLKEELNGHSSLQSHKFTDKILESASRMTTMIEGVLTYSTLSNTKERLTLLNLNSIVSNVITDLEILIDEKSAVIHCGPLPQIEGVETLFYQLFYNLVNNSLKFSRDGIPAVITIAGNTTTNDNKTTVTIMIRDNGIGFEEEYNQTIFHTFTRLHAKSQYDGTGLGLSLVKKIVELHNGTISASGQVGEGAVFTLSIPVAVS